MKRDSRWWWVGMASAMVLALSSRMDLIDPLLPAEHTDKAHAIIEMVAMIAGIASGYLKASPLDISDKGREQYQDDVVRLRPLDGDD
jgi:hypothetical protein